MSRRLMTYSRIARLWQCTKAVWRSNRSNRILRRCFGARAGGVPGCRDQCLTMVKLVPGGRTKLAAMGPVMSKPLSRRQLFKRFKGGSVPIRPPFALAEERFTDVCSRCDDCLRVCEPGVLVRGDGGFPEIVFSRGGCTFCGACADACQVGAFDTERGEPRLTVTATVTPTCLDRRGISCRLCESWCAEDAIRFRPMVGGLSDVIIDRARCTGCGACVAPCPAAAIAMTQSPSKEERMPA